MRLGKLGVSLLSCLLFCVACKEEKKDLSAVKQKKVAKPLAVKTVVLGKESLTDKMVTTGETLGNEQVMLSFESSGKITEILFKEGEYVQKGQLLAKINDRPLQAQLKKLESELPLLEDILKRKAELFKEEAVSLEERQQAETNHLAHLAEIEKIKAEIEQTELRAPFSGVLGLRQLSEGATVTPTTSIVGLTQVRPLKIEFAVPESYSTSVNVGDEVTFYLKDADGMNVGMKAKVFARESALDKKTRTLLVRARYENKKGELLPGRFTSVEMTKKFYAETVMVPTEALIPEMGKQTLYLFKNGKARLAEVRVGVRTAGRTQVLEGISAGDTLITTGVMQLRDGMKVSANFLD